MEKKQFVLTTFLLITSAILFLKFPNIGLYVCCLSIMTISILFIKLKFIFRIIFSVFLSALTFTSLIDKAYELQALKVVNMLIDYYNSNNKTVPPTLNIDNKFKINSYTPLFDKYTYDNNYDSLRYFFFQLCYTDMWGRIYYYDDKEGEFRRINKTSN